MRSCPVTEVNSRQPVLSEDEARWLRVRGYLRDHRYDLAVTASDELYDDLPRAAGTPLLTSPAWMPDQPVPLDQIQLELDTAAAKQFEPPPPRYSEVLGRLAAPSVFENRPTYRLLAADLAGPRPAMRFSLGRYFDAIDTGEALGHEYAAEKLGEPHGTQRADTGSPVDPARRPMNVAVSALTIRLDRRSGDARFLLHWRDPAKVGHAGGLYQVIPVGVFQPATDHPDSVRNDFSLWRCLVREFAEELLGEEEAAPDSGPINYEKWPLAADLDAERRRGTIRTFCLGLGVDPLTLATDLLCVAVIDAPVFDRLFATLVTGNAEGELAESCDDGPGLPFNAAEVDRLSQREPMQAAGAAVLRLAWGHRVATFAR
jgi:hypothetical protein